MRSRRHETTNHHCRLSSKERDRAAALCAMCVHSSVTAAFCWLGRAAWVKSEAETPTIADQSSTCDVVCVFYLKDFKTATEDSFLLAFPCCEETEAGF